MARKKKTIDNSDEALNKVIRKDGVGEDKAVSDLVTGKLATMSNLDAAQLAMALQQIVRGENSLLAQQMTEQTALINKRMAEMDKAAEKFEKDKAQFFDEMHELLEKTRKNSDKDREIVKGSEAYKNELAKARAKNQAQLMKFHEEIKKAPKVTVMSFGVPVTVSIDGRPQIQIRPEVIRIADMQWVLQPNVPTDVPKPVADALANKRKSQVETSKFEEAMRGNLEVGTLDKRLEEIRKQTEAVYDESLTGIPPI